MRCRAPRHAGAGAAGHGGLVGQSGGLAHRGYCRGPERKRRVIRLTSITRRLRVDATRSAVQQRHGRSRRRPRPGARLQRDHALAELSCGLVPTSGSAGRRFPTAGGRPGPHKPPLPTEQRKFRPLVERTWAGTELSLPRGATSMLGAAQCHGFGGGYRQSVPPSAMPMLGACKSLLPEQSKQRHAKNARLSNLIERIRQG